MDLWFAEVQDFVREKNESLVSILRSDVGMDSQAGSDDYSYYIVWLPQRIAQMEKVFAQL